MPGNSPPLETRDTIFALATAPGRAGVAMVRVSGPDAAEAIARLTGKNPPYERQAVLRSLFDQTSNDRIDQALVLFFAPPRSYTGEPVAEFHTHGGRAVVTAVLAALGRIPGLRPAEPGEFTRRAVEKGRLDLIRAEAIADLVNAETEAQRRLALRQYDGHLGHLYEDWRARLIRAAAWIEAEIDFPDEDIPATARKKSRAALHTLLDDIRAHLADGRRGEILRDGLHVAVIGPPNAGKSSLVNALARREVAIVSPIPGTTRDVIEARLDLGGYPVILADTAGLRHSGDSIEQEGVRRARARAQSADLRILVLDGANDGPETGLLGPSDILVHNKADLASVRTNPGLWISAKTGEGIAALLHLLTERASQLLAGGEAPVLTRARHRHALEEAHKSLESALATPETELAAEHIRQALRQIGRITGRVDLDELLDVVFRDFCIGK